MKKLCNIYIFIFILDFVNVENPAYWQKLFRHELRLQETPGTISRSEMLHHLLPVRDRLHQITPATSPLCTLCNNSCPETLQHALLTCQYNAGTGQALISTLQRILPAMSADRLLLLQFPSLSESQEMSAVFLTAALLLEVWTKRSKKIRITLYDIRSALEARCSLLRETRFHNMHETLKELIESL